MFLIHTSLFLTIPQNCGPFSMELFTLFLYDTLSLLCICFLLTLIAFVRTTNIFINSPHLVTLPYPCCKHNKQGDPLVGSCFALCENVVQSMYNFINCGIIGKSSSCNFMLHRPKDVSVSLCACLTKKVDTNTSLRML